MGPPFPKEPLQIFLDIGPVPNEKAPANSCFRAARELGWLHSQPNYMVPTPLIGRFRFSGFRSSRSCGNKLVTLLRQQFFLKRFIFPFVSRILSTRCCGIKHVFTLLRQQCFLIALHFSGSDGPHMLPFHALIFLKRVPDCRSKKKQPRSRLHRIHMEITAFTVQSRLSPHSVEVWHHRVLTPHMSRVSPFQLPVSETKGGSPDDGVTVQSHRPKKATSCTTIHSGAGGTSLDVLHDSSGIERDSPGYGITQAVAKHSTLVFSSGPLSDEEIVFLNTLDHIQTAFNAFSLLPTTGITVQGSHQSFMPSARYELIQPSSFKVLNATACFKFVKETATSVSHGSTSPLGGHKHHSVRLRGSGPFSVPTGRQTPGQKILSRTCFPEGRQSFRQQYVLKQSATLAISLHDQH